MNEWRFVYLDFVWDNSSTWPSKRQNKNSPTASLTFSVECTSFASLTRWWVCPSGMIEACRFVDSALHWTPRMIFHGPREQLTPSRPAINLESRGPVRDPDFIDRSERGPAASALRLRCECDVLRRQTWNKFAGEGKRGEANPPKRLLYG